jgi:hypothetical protein
MPVGTVVTDEYLKHFIDVTNSLSAEYAEQLEGWTESPFAWILTLPSRSRGAVGEKIVAQWLTSNGCRVSRPLHSGCDRVVNGINMEIKFSTLWKSGGYTFQQLRDQDYSFVFCLGLSPNEVHAWLIPKEIAWNHATPQHGGKAGKDTKWLSFPANSPPPWLTAYGGSLADVLKMVQRMGKS